MRNALFHEGPWYAFSNFSAFSVNWRGRVWQTAEHAYQAAKFTDQIVITLVREATSAHEAKQVARKYAELKRSDWSDELKLSIMEEILWAKVMQHEYVRHRLLGSGNMELVENSPDIFWGRGTHWKGANHLGVLWMKIRAALRAELPQTQQSY